MQQDRVAFAVEAHGHAADRALDDAALERDILRLEIGDERIEILDLECDCAAGGGAWLLPSEVGEREAAAARQIVFDPPLIAAIAMAADRKTELVLIEVPRPPHVSDRIHGEGNFLELHGAFL